MPPGTLLVAQHANPDQRSLTHDARRRHPDSTWCCKRARELGTACAVTRRARGGALIPFVADPAHALPASPDHHSRILRPPRVARRFGGLDASSDATARGRSRRGARAYAIGAVSQAPTPPVCQHDHARLRLAAARAACKLRASDAVDGGLEPGHGRHRIAPLSRPKRLRGAVAIGVAVGLLQPRGPFPRVLASTLMPVRPSRFEGRPGR
jgi:hypothetical protein